MHISKSELKTVELVLCSFYTILVRVKGMWVYKLENTNFKGNTNTECNFGDSTQEPVSGIELVIMNAITLREPQRDSTRSAFHCPSSTHFPNYLLSQQPVDGFLHSLISDRHPGQLLQIVTD